MVICVIVAPIGAFRLMVELRLAGSSAVPHKLAVKVSINTDCALSGDGIVVRIAKRQTPVGMMKFYAY